MEGRHPGTGRWLRPEGAGGGRGGGIDATFSAPKSVSTVWALADPWQRQQIEDAHASAVERTDPLHARDGAGGAPPLRRRRRRGAREGPDRDRVPAHHRQRCLRRRGPGPAAAQPRRHHRRRPRGRPFRRGRLAAGLPRRAGARRLLPLGARGGADREGLRDRAWHRQGRPLLRARRRSVRAERGVLRTKP